MSSINAGLEICVELLEMGVEVDDECFCALGFSVVWKPSTDWPGCRGTQPTAEGWLGCDTGRLWRTGLGNRARRRNSIAGDFWGIMEDSPEVVISGVILYLGPGLTNYCVRQRRARSASAEG